MQSVLVTLVFYGHGLAFFDQVSRSHQLAIVVASKVNIDYHIEVDEHYYSVPHTLVGKEVEARYTKNIVEVVFNNRRVASHKRSYTSDGSLLSRLGWSPQFAFQYTWLPRSWPVLRRVMFPSCCQSHPPQLHRWPCFG